MQVTRAVMAAVTLVFLCSAFCLPWGSGGLWARKADLGADEESGFSTPVTPAAPLPADVITEPLLEGVEKDPGACFFRQQGTWMQIRVKSRLRVAEGVSSRLQGEPAVDCGPAHLWGVRFLWLVLKMCLQLNVVLQNVTMLPELVAANLQA